MHLLTLFLSILSIPLAIAETDILEPSDLSIAFYTDQHCYNDAKYEPNMLYDNEYTFATSMGSYWLSRSPLPAEQLDLSTYADTPNTSPCSVYLGQPGEDPVLGTPGPQECVEHLGTPFVCARLWHY